MTQTLNKCCNVGVLLLLCAASACVSAEVLPDPTKPPAEISAPQGGGMLSANLLRTIIISPHRRAAIIDGQTVELGAKYGNARLIEVSASGVVLEGSQGRQALTLFPGVEITKNTVVLPTQVEHEVKRVSRKAMPVYKPGNGAAKREKSDE